MLVETAAVQLACFIKLDMATADILYLRLRLFFINMLKKLIKTSSHYSQSYILAKVTSKRKHICYNNKSERARLLANASFDFTQSSNGN